MRFGWTLCVLFPAAIISACSPNTPKGWSPRHQCGSDGNCWSIGSSPDDGRWLGFQLGMSRDAAIAAACDAVRKNLAQFDSIKLDQQSHRCVTDLDQTDDWFATADGISCFPWGGAFISLEFDGKGGRLKRIAAYCRNTFDL